MHPPGSRGLFLTSLYAVANADGNLSDQERAEIDDIALELGFPAVAGEDGAPGHSDEENTSD